MEKKSEVQKLKLNEINQENKSDNTNKDIRGCSHYKRKAKFVVSLRKFNCSQGSHVKLHGNFIERATREKKVKFHLKHFLFPALTFYIKCHDIQTQSSKIQFTSF